jgi:hypothetical protein
LLGDPELLILDESMNGLDPRRDARHAHHDHEPGRGGPRGAARDVVADINRRLVSAGISVYGLQEAHASLEDWFLSVTSPLSAGGQP